jgi:hypothetical protein
MLCLTKSRPRLRILLTAHYSQLAMTAELKRTAAPLEFHRTLDVAVGDV